MGEVGNHVHAALGLDPVEQGIDDGGDLRAHGFDPAGGEGLGDQAAQAGVVGRVENQHGAGHAGEGGLVDDVRPIALGDVVHIAFAEAAVAQHQGGVVVARDDREAER